MSSLLPQIVILGYACRLPGSPTNEAFWEVLDQARCVISAIPKERFSAARYFNPNRLTSGKSVSFAAGVVDNAFDFDPGFFGISPREAIQMDPQQRMLAQVVWEALENAGVPAASLKGSQTGVFVGASSLDHMQAFVNDPGSVDTQLVTGNTLSIVANRISFLLDIRGPSITVDTACSSSLVALHQACSAIASGAIDTAIVGGVNFLAAPHPFSGFSRAFMLSQQGLCRAFDADGDGYVRAEGAVAIVIQSAKVARAASRRARANIVGWGVNCDGRTPGLAMPSSEAQSALLCDVYESSGVDPNDLAFIEAHGTGTRVGDPLEASALGKSVGILRRDALPIGSVKTNIGHLEPASGLAGLLKAVLALENDRLPASLHFDTPNPDIPFGDLNLCVAGKGLDLPRNGKVRFAGVNSFGFGGSNAHVILSDGDIARPARARTAGPIVVSAASKAGLQALAQRYADALPADEAGYAAFAGATVWRRDLLDYRAILLPGAAPEARVSLAALADGAPGAGVVLGQAVGARGCTVFAFSGNGSQWPGMGQAAFAANPTFRKSIERTDAIFSKQAGWSIVEALTADDVAERIKHADVVQPLLFAIQVATADALADYGVRPAAVLGHSAGEVAAACVAGAISREDGLKIIDVRSAFQEPMRGKGTMAALVLPEADAEAALASPAFAGVEIAAVNTGRSLTLSGPEEAIATFLKYARKQRWPYVRLDIEYPFHSSQLDPFRDEVIDALASIRPKAGGCPFISTVTGEVMEGGQLDAAYWWLNVRERVRFEAGVTKALSLAPRTLLEVGPAPILTSYLSEIARYRGSSAASLATLERADCVEHDPILKAAARILAHGGDVDLEAVAGPAEPEDVTLPNYVWQNARFKMEPSSEAESKFLPDIHPLLGMPHVRDALTFYHHLDYETSPWLGDHRVEDAIVFPAAGLIELALAGARQSLGEVALELNDCAILRPLVITPGVTRTLMTQSAPREGAVSIESRPRGSQEEWTQHAKARFSASPISAHPSDLPPVTSPRRRADGASVYELMARYQLNYGPIFRRLSSVSQIDDTTCCVAFAPAPEGWPTFILDPAILDSAFHAALWMLHGENAAPPRDMTVVPTFIERVRVFKPGAAIHSARLTVTAKPGGSGVLNSMMLLDADENVVAMLSGGRFARVHLSAQGDAPAIFGAVQAPLASRIGGSPLANCRLDMTGAADAVIKAAQIHASAGVALSTLATTALRVAACDGAEQGADLSQAMQRLLAVAPELVTEAVACASFARGLPSRAFEGVSTGSPAASLFAQAGAQIVQRLLADWPSHAPLRVLAVGLGDAAGVRRISSLLPPDVGSLSLSDFNAPRLARLGALLPPKPCIAIVDWSPSAHDQDAFDLILVCDPLADWPDGARDVAIAHAMLAPGGALALVRSSESDFTHMIRRARTQAAAVPQDALSLTLEAAGFIAIESAISAGPCGDILLASARKPLETVQAETLAAPARQAELVTFGDVDSTSLAVALASKGVHLVAAADTSSLPDEVVFFAPGLGFADPLTEVANLLSTYAALLRRIGSHKVRLTTIVSGANTANGAAAALWGFVRVAINETPNVDFRLVDVDGDIVAPELAAIVACEIAQPARERELVVSPHGVRALRARELSSSPETSREETSLRLEIVGQGSLERLSWLPEQRKAPAAGEIEIQVEAAGLNFRDVMWALGLLPPEALENGFAGATLGMECAGRVSRVGAGVEGFSVGDAVVAFAPGSFAQHACVPAFAVAHRPASLTADAAATLPVAFVTSWYSLVHLARVERGEWVLVHGGAGGVGLAAIQILRLLGARVLATAGTPERRQLLLDLGVDHVLDSRSLVFADEVMALTGGVGVDVVLNSLAGEAMERSIGCLRPFGRFIELGKRDFFANTRVGLRPFRQNLSYFGVDADQLLVGQKDLAQRLFRDVMAHFATGELTSLPWRAFEGEDVTSAFRLMQQSGHIGKIIVHPPVATQSAAQPAGADTMASVRGDGSYLIIGGLGGFGLALAHWLAKRGAGRLVLVGRRGVVDESVRATLDAIDALGCETIVQSADASDLEQLRQVVASIPSDKPLRGVFHAAMTLDDVLIAKLDASRIEPVLRSKIAVAANLDVITAQMDIDIFVLFSSATVLLGNPGQANYVAANAWLEALARGRRARGLPALAVGWGAISDVGYLTRGGEAGKTLLRRLQRHALAADEALDGLGSLLLHSRGADAPASAVFARLDWAALSRDLPILSTPLFDDLRVNKARGDDTSALGVDLARLPLEKARARILAELAAEIGKIMRIPPEQVDQGKALAELGIDSLMGVELRLAAEEKFGVDVPLLSIGSAGSLADLANLILKQVREAPAKEG